MEESTPTPDTPETPTTQRDPTGEYSIGDNGLVIPTDMAITALMQLSDVYSIYINLDTIVRNTIDAFPSELKERLTPQRVFTIIQQDISNIAELLPNTDITYYLPRYRNLSNVFRLMKPRIATTPKQLKRKGLSDKVHTLLDRWSTEQQLKRHYTTGNALGMPRIESAYVLTHHPVDLLHAAKDIRLIESNTGAVLTAVEFNRKLYNGKEFPNLPFNTLTLCVMGDGYDFRPMERKVKETLLSIAKEFKWTPITPHSVIKADLKSQRDQLANDVFTLILNSFN